MTRGVFRLAPLFLLLGCLLLSSCSEWNAAYPVQLTLTPSDVNDAAAGETCVLLVQLSATSLQWINPSGQLPLHVDCLGAKILQVPDDLSPGEIGEIHLVPDPSTIGTSIEVAVTSVPGIPPGNAQLHITEPPTHRDTLIRAAALVRDVFIPWLVDGYPDLNITPTTLWTAVPIRTHRLVVTHCLFLSEEWEMAVWWHVTIAPHDWARIYIRRRHDESTPSLAAEISSQQLGGEPHEIGPPPAIFR